MSTNSNADFIQTLKAKASIAEVVGEIVRLKKAGSNLMGLCPFHSERSPSFSVSEKKGIYHCFGCQKSGDVISFIQETQGVGFVEAIRILSEKYGLKLPKEMGHGSGEKSPGSELEVYYRLNHFSAQFYHQKLLSPEGKKAKEYLNQRGVTDEIIKQYHLGWSPNAWSELFDFLHSKKAPLEKAEELGLIRKRSDASKARSDDRQYYDFFRNRVMFPVIDRKGRVVAFGGRSFEDEDGPKYLNSADSVIFKKSLHLYGIFQAQKEIRAEDRVLICEGYMDCLSLHQHGVGYAVATLGTAVGLQQIKGLKRLSENIILLFDGDQAGQNAQLKAMEVCLEADVVARGLVLPDELDPDEFIQERGVEQLIENINKSPAVLDQKIIELATQARANADVKARSLEQVFLWLSKLSSETARQLRFEEMAQLFSVGSEFIEKQYRKLYPNANKGGEKSVFPTKRPIALNNNNSLKSQNKIQPIELRALEILVLYPQMALGLSEISEFLKGFDSEEASQVFLQMHAHLTGANAQSQSLQTHKSHMQNLRQNPQFEFDSEILKYSQNTQIYSLFTRALVTLEAEKGKEKGTRDSEEIVKEWDDLVLKIRRHYKEKRRDQIKAQLLKLDQTGSENERLQLMQEYSEIVKSLDVKFSADH